MDPIPLRFVGRELPRLQGSGFRASRVRLNDEKKNCLYCHIRQVKITPCKCDNVKLIATEVQRAQDRRLGRRPEATKSGHWYDTHPFAFTFLTGVVYVQRVRFEDGTIWIVDRLDILKKLFEMFPQLNNEEMYKKDKDIKEKNLVDDPNFLKS